MRKQLIGLISLVASVMSFGVEGDYLIKGVEFVNVNEIPKEVLLDKMSLKEGDKFTTEALLKDYNNIRKAEYIDSLSIYPQIFDGGIKLVVDVKEKKDTKNILESKGIVPMSEQEKIDKNLIISSLEIIGGVNISTSEIAKKIPVEVGGYYSRNKIIKGQEELYKTGLFREVIPDVYQYPEGLVVVYSVIENPVVEGINIVGNTKFSTEELEKLMKVKTGEILNYNDLRESTEAILRKYNENGYVLAKYQNVGFNNYNQLEIIISEGIVDEVVPTKMITKQKGQRRKASDTEFKTRDYVIDREIEIKKGEVFNINDYNETANNLYRTRFFKNVKYDVKDIPGNPDGKKIELLLEEERTASLEGAISYGSEQGFLGMLSVKDSNWKGKGQELGVSFEKSDEDYSSISINFSDPWIKDTDRISWGWSLYKNQYENSDNYLFHEIDSYGFRTNIGKGITKNVRIGLGMKYEHIQEEIDRSANLSQELLKKWGEKRDYNLYSIYPSITYDNRLYDNRSNSWNAISGWYAKYQIETGYSDGVESGNFANTTLELRTYHRGLFKNNTFAYRLVGGIMTDSTPESQRFWVGGGSTLRGYDGGYYQGTKKITGTIENRTQLNEVLGVVLFADFGRAWDYNGDDPGYRGKNRDKSFPDEIAKSVGIGLRVTTPVGPLRFDFGWPMGDSEESGMKFYFNMGHSF